MSDKELSKERFKELCKLHIKRDGIDKLLEYLETTDFYNAPASTKYHGNYEGGLVAHSLNVFTSILWDENMNVFNMESLAVCALFHDICKTNFYTIEMRNAKNEQGQWVKVPYYSVNDTLPYGHGEKSVYILSSFIKLDRAEAMAIRWHMGGFDDSVKGGSYALSEAYSNYPLALELNIADMRATYMLDKKI